MDEVTVLQAPYMLAFEKSLVRAAGNQLVVVVESEATRSLPQQGEVAVGVLAGLGVVKLNLLV